MNILSIEVGEHFTRVGNVHVNRGRYTLAENFTVKTPADIYDDGYIRNDEELIDLLFASFHKYGITNRRAAFVVTSSKIINREVVLPQVANNKIRPLVMSNISEYFPVDLTVYQISWKVMEKFTEDNQKKMRLMVIAVPKDLVENYYELAQHLGVSLQSIDYAGNAIYQLVKNIDKDGTMFSLHIGDSTSVASVVSNGILELQRNIPFGMDYIIDNVMEYFPEAKRNRAAVLEILKANQWVNGMIEIDEDDDESGLSDDEKKKKRITETIKPFIDRIERLVHYYISMKNTARLDRMVITGIGSTICGLPNLLQFELGMVVGGIGNIKNVKIDGRTKKNVAEQNSSQDNLNIEIDNELTTIAMGIGCLVDPVDLLPAVMNGRRNANVSLTPGIAALVAALAVSGGMIVWSQLTYNKAVDKKTELTARIDELEPVEKVYSDHKAIETVYIGTQNMINSSRTPNEGLVHFIEELEQKMPSNMTVASINASATGVEMNVQTGSWEESADVIRQLRTFESIKGISFSGVTQNENVIEKEHYVYLVDGKEVDSIADAIEDGAEVVMEKRTEEITEITYSFSVRCDWADIYEIIEEPKQPESTEEKTVEEGDAE